MNGKHIINIAKVKHERTFLYGLHDIKIILVYEILWHNLNIIVRESI